MVFGVLACAAQVAEIRVWDERLYDHYVSPAGLLWPF